MKQLIFPFKEQTKSTKGTHSSYIEEPDHETKETIQQEEEIPENTQQEEDIQSK